MVRDNIDENDTHLWVFIKENLFPRIRQRCLNKNLLNELVMTQIFIRER